MPQAPRHSTILAALILLTAVTLAYLPAIKAGFIWDDDVLVTDNPLIIDHSGLPAIWFSTAPMDYTPLTLTSFWLEWRLWAKNPIGYHITNILLHAASALILWRVLLKLKIPGAWIGALLFAVHPVNTASVAWIAERKNTLSLFFYLLAALWYLDYEERPAWRTYLPSLAAAACAFLSKGSTVILPAALACCVWWRGRAWSRQRILALIPFAALAAAAAALTILFQSRIIYSHTAAESLALRTARAGDAVWFYLWKDLMPWSLCTYYPKWTMATNHPWTYLPALLVVLVTVIFYRFRGGWSRGFLFAWLYFLLALAPVLGFVNMSFMEQAYVADWWQQLAMIGVLALIAAGIARLMDSPRRWLRGGVAAVLAMVCLFLAARTWTEAQYYRSAEVHCRHAIACNPLAWAAEDNLGSALHKEGRLGEAEMQYRASLRIRPDNFTAHSNLALVLNDEGRTDEAIQEFAETLRLNPADAIAHNNLGLLLQGRGNVAGAIAEFQTALRLRAFNPEARNNLGTELEAAGRYDDAISQFEEALRERPDFEIARQNLAAAQKARESMH